MQERRSTWTYRTECSLQLPYLIVWSLFTNFTATKSKRGELSGTGGPPSLLDEVQERRSGFYRGGGAAYRLVPAEIKN